jgi:hypothetical protein
VVNPATAVAPRTINPAISVAARKLDIPDPFGFRKDNKHIAKARIHENSVFRALQEGSEERARALFALSLIILTGDMEFIEREAGSTFILPTELKGKLLRHELVGGFAHIFWVVDRITLKNTGHVVKLGLHDAAYFIKDPVTDCDVHKEEFFSKLLGESCLPVRLIKTLSLKANRPISLDALIMKAGTRSVYDLLVMENDRKANGLPPLTTKADWDIVYECLFVYWAAKTSAEASKCDPSLRNMIVLQDTKTGRVVKCWVSCKV